jgi:hypothetical protein
VQSARGSYIEEALAAQFLSSRKHASKNFSEKESQKQTNSHNSAVGPACQYC